jgi:hypothetical protein
MTGLYETISLGAFNTRPGHGNEVHIKNPPQDLIGAVQLKGTRLLSLGQCGLRAVYPVSDHSASTPRQSTQHCDTIAPRASQTARIGQKEELLLQVISESQSAQ